MKAVWYRSPGPAHEVLTYGDLDAPEPVGDELLVRIEASGVNPSDVKQRAGLFRFGPASERTIPHQDGAGVVVASGRGSDDPLLGTAVWIFFAQLARPFGTAAQLVLVERGNVAPLPAQVPFEDGASLGVPALTAYAALTAIKPPGGETILVQGGAGAVGGYAVQLAAHLGVRVIATVRDGEKAAIARDYGAQQVIRRSDPALEDSVMALTDGRGVDRIIEVDFAANVALDAKLLATHGTIASYSSPSAPTAALPYYALAGKNGVVAFVQIYRTPRAVIERGVALIGSLLETGRLKCRVAHRLPLSRTADAHRLVESGEARGKVVVIPD